MGKGKYKGRRAEAFIFDLDGTLVDSGLDIALSANFTRLHFGLPELQHDIVRSYVGDGVTTLLQRALGHNTANGKTGVAGLHVSEEMVSTGLKVFGDHYSRHLLDNTTLYPGVLDILMRYRDFDLHVATNKPNQFANQVLSALHIDSVFRKVVAGDDVPACKPDPLHLQACLEGLDVDPADVVVVGDSPNDVNAARALGAISVGCTYGLTAPGILKSSVPDFTINSFSELAGLFPSRRS